MAQHWTDHREGVRGKLTADWTPRWATGSGARIEGSHIDAPHRNSLRLTDGIAAGARHLFTWNAPDADTGRADQVIRCLLHPIASFSGDLTMATPVLRAGGSTGAENGYRLSLPIDSTTLKIQRLLSGASFDLTSGTVTAPRLGGYYWILFEITDDEIRVKYYPYGTAEPGLWTLTTSDENISDGRVGMLHYYDTAILDVPFFSVGTNGSTAPEESTVLASDPPMSVWINQPGVESITTVRVEYYNPGTNTVSEEWISSSDVNTSVADYPSNVVMKPLLLDAGLITRRLEGDLQFGKAGSVSSPVRFENVPPGPTSPGPFDAYQTYSFSGRPVEIRMGRKWQTPPIGMTPGVPNPHRRFEIVQCATVSMPNDEGAREVSVTPEEVSLNIESSPSYLSNKLPVHRNIGIPTGVKSLSSSGWLSIPNNAAYNITSYAVYMRIMIPAAGVTGTGYSTLSRRGTDGGTNRQWQLALYHTSHATFANRIQLNIDANDATSLGAVVSTVAFNDAGRFIDILFGVKAAVGWYFYASDPLYGGMKKIGSGTTAKTPNNPSLGVEVLRASTGLIVCDHRIEQYVPEDEALARFSTRREPDILTVSMHRCDDGLGSTVTDYATLANHGTLQGTDAVDRSWVPTYIGDAEQAGTPMPISGGVLFHAPTQKVDSTRNIFRYNDRGKTTGASGQIRAKGLPLSAGSAWTDGAFEALGTADIVSTPDEPITFGLPVSVPATALENEEIHIPRLVKDELVNRGLLTPREIDKDSFSALRTLLPMSSGFYYSEPPDVRTFLSDMLGGGESGSALKGIASHFQIDRYSRLVAGCVMPPVNPGLYGQDNILEFLGAPGKGVSFPSNSAFNLTNVSNKVSIAALIKVWRSPVDNSTSSTFTYFPQGMTIIDRVAGASGYYLGFDGRNGKLIFGAPGVTNTSGGLHFSSFPLPLVPNRWYVVFAYQDGNTRGIIVSDTEGSIQVTEGTSGTITAPTGHTPLRIGHGPFGSYYGAISYVIGSSTLRNLSWASAWVTSRPTYDSSFDRFFIPLNDGNNSDSALDTATGTYGRIEGARWCPSMILDFTSIVPDPVPEPATFDPLRRPTFAFRTEARYFRNYSRMEGAQVAAGVSTADRTALARDYLSEPDLNQTVKDNYKDSRELITQTPLYRQDNADFIASLIRSRVSADRRYGGVTNWVREVLRLNPTDEILLKHDRFLSAGRPMRVVNILYRLGLLRGDVSLWG